jgi:excisionase family DNA binding protein
MQVVDGVEMLGVREAAAYVRRTPETVRRWVWTGSVSAQRDGNRLLVSRRELDAALGMDDAPALSLQAWARPSPMAPGHRRPIWCWRTARLATAAEVGIVVDASVHTLLTGIRRQRWTGAESDTAFGRLRT